MLSQDLSCRRIYLISVRVSVLEDFRKAIVSDYPMKSSHRRQSAFEEEDEAQRQFSRSRTTAFAKRNAILISIDSVVDHFKI